MTKYIEEMLSDEELKKYSTEKTLNTSINFENVRLLKQNNRSDLVIMKILKNLEQKDDFDVNYE